MMRLALAPDQRIERGPASQSRLSATRAEFERARNDPEPMHAGAQVLDPSESFWRHVLRCASGPRDPGRRHGVGLALITLEVEMLLLTYLFGRRHRHHAADARRGSIP
jgi:hypothetical protein